MKRYEPTLRRLARRSDPSNTAGVAREYSRAFVRRLRALVGVVREAVVAQNVLGLPGGRVTLLQASLPTRRAFDFPTDAAKLDAFMAWFDEAAEAELLERITVPGRGTEPWANTYVRAGYSRGVEHADAAMRDLGVEPPPGGPATTFNRPFHADKLATLYSRNFRELQGITADIGRQVSRTLSEGLATGASPRTMARDLDNAIMSMGRRRATVLARTEIIRSHADATLNRYAEAGISEVRGLAEFLTAQDDRVCPQCELLEGETFPLEEARTMIPVHPQCRCVWLPVFKDPR